MIRKIRNKRIWVTLLLLAAVGTALVTMTMLYYGTERERCFDRLNSYVAHISQAVYQDIDGDRQYLQSLSRVLAREDLTDYEWMRVLLTEMGAANVVTRLELLLPGDQLLTDSGDLKDMRGQLSFTKEASDGVHICWRKAGDGILIRQCVPVERDGQIVAVLCGIIDLERLPHLFFSQEYGENMQFYIIESGTGQFLLDTWHNTLGAVSDLEGRKPGRGYSAEQFHQDVAQHKAGVMVFRSQKAGENFYTSYAPIDVEDWMVMINVPSSAVFSYAEAILRSLYIWIAVLIALFAGYFAWTLRDVGREKQASQRKLENIQYILDVEKNLFQSHTDWTCFQSALHRIAEYLPAELAFFWAIKGSAFQQSQWCSSQGVGDDSRFSELFPELLERLRRRERIICQGPNPAPYMRLEKWRQLFSREVSSLMLIPIEKRSGELVGILGAVNMRQKWDSTEPLEQVELSFSMTAEQHDSYQRLDRLSRLDAMTGLVNRNGYQDMVDALKKERLTSFACVYADANGLHEINNRLGHQAGDKMLIQMADTLKRCFPLDDVYRVGGDEFVVLCRNRPRQEVYERAQAALKAIRQSHYNLSIGIEWRDERIDVGEILDMAEQAMREEKQLFYQSQGKERQLRLLNEQTAKMAAEKQDMEDFVSVLAPQFKGVYFVDLNRDSTSHIFIPSYFKEILRDENGRFSSGLRLYTRQLVMPAYHRLLDELCDYNMLEKWLMEKGELEFTYQKLDGTRLRLQVMKVKNYTELDRRTLWIFTQLQ